MFVLACRSSFHHMYCSQAWVAYESMFRPWYRDRQKLYVDFYCRHLTFGDVGCSLSHLAIWEAAQMDNADLLVVFEDDARPKHGALTYLLKQIEVLLVLLLLYAFQCPYHHNPPHPPTSTLRRLHPEASLVQRADYRCRQGALW